MQLCWQGTARSGPAGSGSGTVRGEPGRQSSARTPRPPCAVGVGGGLNPSGNGALTSHHRPVGGPVSPGLAALETLNWFHPAQCPVFTGPVRCFRDRVWERHTAMPYDVPSPEPSRSGTAVPLSIRHVAHPTAELSGPAQDPSARRGETQHPTSPAAAAAPVHFPSSFSRRRNAGGSPPVPRPRAQPAYRVTGSGRRDTFPTGCTSCPGLVCSQQGAPASP